MRTLTTVALFLSLTGLGLASRAATAPEHPGMTAFKAKDYVTAFKNLESFSRAGGCKRPGEPGNHVCARAWEWIVIPEAAMQLFQAVGGER